MIKVCRGGTVGDGIRCMNHFIQARARSVLAETGPLRRPHEHGGCDASQGCHQGCINGAPSQNVVPPQGG